MFTKEFETTVINFVNAEAHFTISKARYFSEFMVEVLSHFFTIKDSYELKNPSDSYTSLDGFKIHMANLAANFSHTLGKTISSKLSKLASGGDCHLEDYIQGVINRNGLVDCNGNPLKISSFHDASSTVYLYWVLFNNGFEKAVEQYGSLETALLELQTRLNVDGSATHRFFKNEFFVKGKTENKPVDTVEDIQDQAEQTTRALLTVVPVRLEIPIDVYNEFADELKTVLNDYIK